MAPEIRIAPLRSLDDFLCKFQIPNVKDLDKWGNRVVNNFLYYQTNYFLMALIIFLLVGVLHPVKMLSGMLVMALAFGMFFYFTNAKPSAERFKREHPLISVSLILAGGYFIVYMMGGVLVLLFGILLPVWVAFIHASMRLRNIKNKIMNKLELIEEKKTPMGLFLDALGMTPEIIS